VSVGTDDQAFACGRDHVGRDDDQIVEFQDALDLLQDALQESEGYAFVQNLRRGFSTLTAHLPRPFRLARRPVQGYAVPHPKVTKARTG
jgi:hypothetical protein